MKTILIADDNPVSRELVVEALSGEWTVIEADDGALAVARFREERPDLALIDIQMPSLNGFDVLERIRADAQARKAPIIALTAFAMHGDRERAMGAGFDAYITKPVDLAGLREQIRLLLANR
jgi:two-component system cell cycle response regulator DivK